MKISRRDLLKGSLLSLAAGFQPTRASAGGEMPSRILGRTGVRVSVLGYGAMQCADAGAIRHGLDLGVTYVDTANCYMGGRNERIVGEAISGIRDRLFIATKVHIAPESRMMSSLERSLSSLGVERVDLLQLHGMSSRTQIVRKDVQDVLTAMKKEGKVRFAGVTTHANQIEVLEAVAQDGFYDTVLVAVNFRSPDTLFHAIERAADKGVGIIAMKTQNGGYRDSTFPGLTPHQAALRYVLDKPGIHLAVPGMLSRRMVDENLEAVMGKAGLSDLMRLDLYRAGLAGKACSFCSGCLDQCPRGTGGVDAVRIAMYGEGYQDRPLALERGREVSDAVRDCARCPDCVVTCSQGIDIREAARRALTFLA